MLMQVMTVFTTQRMHSGSTGQNGHRTRRRHRVPGDSSWPLLLLLAVGLYLQLRS